MKYVKRFYDVSTAKAATDLVSPNISSIKLNDVNHVLMIDCGTNVPVEIKEEDGKLIIEEKITEQNVTVFVIFSPNSSPIETPYQIYPEDEDAGLFDINGDYYENASELTEGETYYDYDPTYKATVTIDSEEVELYSDFTFSEQGYDKIIYIDTTNNTIYDAANECPYEPIGDEVYKTYNDKQTYLINKFNRESRIHNNEFYPTNICISSVSTEEFFNNIVETDNYNEGGVLRYVMLYCGDDTNMPPEWAGENEYPYITAWSLYDGQTWDENYSLITIYLDDDYENDKAYQWLQECGTLQTI